MTVTPQENAALARRFLTDVVAGGDVDAFDGFLAADVVGRNLVFGADHDREAVIALGWRVLAAADIDSTIEDTVATGDRPVVRDCLLVVLPDRERSNRGDSLAPRRPWANARTRRSPGIIDELSANQINRPTREMRHGNNGLFEVSSDGATDFPAAKRTEVDIDDGA